jgi:hypothetical protein
MCNRTSYTGGEGRGGFQVITFHSNYTAIVPPADFKCLQSTFYIQLWKPWYLAVGKCVASTQVDQDLLEVTVWSFESCPPAFVLHCYVSVSCVRLTISLPSVS